MSDLTAYYGCNCCSHHISYPAYELGITEDGTLWHWECYENKYDYDDPNKPVLEKFVPPEDKRIQQLEEERRWESGSIQPPLCRPYLVHTSGVTVVMEWDGECWRGLDDGYIYAVTHWMKLPPPPKENNNDR